ncbi:MAG: pilus assembly protein PilP [Porticoccaceae bacterium]|nr:pilus assembly protein PilP [Porticoccaceae bacterium]
MTIYRLTALPVLSALCLVALLGCSGDRQHSDLDQKLLDARNRPQGTIEPLPTYPPAERFNYSALALRSPFEAPVILNGEEKVSGNVVAAPDQSRRKEPLELINYSALSMVGTLSRGGNTWALINDGNGRVHRVTNGNYVGRNFGLITNIGTFEVEIMETVPDGKGEWINRPRTMAMDEE